MEPCTQPTSPISKFRSLKNPPVERKAKVWEQNFPIDVRPIVYPPGAGADKVGLSTGNWQVAMNPTARFNVRAEKASDKKPAFNNNAALHEALATSRLGQIIKCLWPTSHAQCTPSSR